MGHSASKLLITLAMIVGLFGAVPSFAGEGRFFEKMAKEINLTPEQQEQLKKIHTQSKDEMRGKREAMKAAHEALEEALRGTVPDDEVRAKFSKLQSLQDEFAKARFEKVLSVRAILTPEQRKSFKGMDKGMGKGHRHGKFGHGHAKDE